MYHNGSKEVISGFNKSGKCFVRKELLKILELGEYYELFMNFRIYLILYIQGIYCHIMYRLVVSFILT
jgi:hypothetical protein